MTTTESHLLRKLKETTKFKSCFDFLYHIVRHDNLRMVADKPIIPDVGGCPGDDALLTV